MRNESLLTTKAQRHREEWIQAVLCASLSLWWSSLRHGGHRMTGIGERNITGIAINIRDNGLVLDVFAGYNTPPIESWVVESSRELPMRAGRIVENLLAGRSALTLDDLPRNQQ